MVSLFFNAGKLNIVFVFFFLNKKNHLSFPSRFLVIVKIKRECKDQQTKKLFLVNTASSLLLLCMANSLSHSKKNLKKKLKGETNRNSIVLFLLPFSQFVSIYVTWSWASCDLIRIPMVGCRELLCGPNSMSGAKSMPASQLFDSQVSAF